MVIYKTLSSLLFYNFENISVENSLFLQERIVEENEQLGLKSLFNRWYMTKISLIMFYNWMAATIGYYGLGMFSVHLAGDIYINFVLSALIEIPSYIFCVLVNQFFFHSNKSGPWSRQVQK